MNFAALGDSITSDFVSGIGTRIGKKLNADVISNYACGWATCSDWHYSDESITFESLVPVHTYSPENVLSNQVLRLINDYGNKNSPDIIYIAISTNDGSVDWCTEKGTPTPVKDDTAEVFLQSYMGLDRQSIASALRWAVETLIMKYPSAKIFAASPLQAYSPARETGALSEASGLIKRDIIRKTCDFCHIYFIDSYAESGFTRDVAKGHGEVHPDEIWQEKIADYVCKKILQS